MAKRAVRRYHPDVEGYFTLEELAAYLGVKSTGSLRTQIKLGAIKAERVGNKTYIVSKSEAARYKEQRRGGPGHPRKPKGGADA
jgi:hypothetical protein